MWETVEWSQVLTIRNGKSQKAVVDDNGAYPIYGSGGVMGYANDFLCNENTVVIGRKGSINNPILVKEKFWNVDTAFGLDANPEVLDYRYLYYFCLQFDFTRLNTTVTIPSLTKANLLTIKMPLPPLEVQQKIATVLEKADNLIAMREKQFTKLDELLQSIFVDMFGDPVKNSKGWEVKKLGDLGELDRGKSKHRPRNDPKLLGGNYPLIQTGDVANAGCYIQKYTSTYSELGLSQSRMWEKGTLCITIAANIAKTGILSFDSCFPDSVVGFHPNESMTTTEFILVWFTFLQAILEKSAPESAQKNINLRILRDLDVICPPITEVKKFSSILHKLELEIREVNNHSLDKVRHLFDALNQKAFKDELDIR